MLSEAVERSVRPLTIAIMALGGQGGGVLADWTVRVGELAGYRAQYTSVQGVAQRTGATIYYIELYPEAEIAARGKEPVLALMPAPGDVDVVVASELMEAGRAIMRGFVTPDRTTLIGSSHRVFAISEKIAMGDGRQSEDAVHEAAQAQAKAWICFDMEKTAREGGSVISAAMFGALAGSNALPIPRSVFEDVIRESGKAVEANLRTFDLAFDRARGDRLDLVSTAAIEVSVAQPATQSVMPLLARIEQELPFIAQDLARHGLRRVIDFQDIAYGSLYLDRLTRIAEWDKAAAGSAQRHTLLCETARHLALWMSFDDTFRVADLKTRGSRFDRVETEVNAAPGQIVNFTEFMHPRLEEVADSLPAWLGCRVAGWLWLAPLFAHGRKITTSSLRGYLLLSLVASGRRWRRSTMRFQREDVAIEAWLDRIRECAELNYSAAVELARCQKLVRGYGETHSRGARNLAAILAVYDEERAVPGLAKRIRDLRVAAEADEDGKALASSISRIEPSA